MKFYGRGVVWNPNENKALCEFSKSGILETEDEGIIDALKKMGFKTEGKEEFIAGGRIKMDVKNADKEIAPGITIKDAVQAIEETKKKRRKRKLQE